MVSANVVVFSLEIFFFLCNPLLRADYALNLATKRCVASAKFVLYSMPNRTIENQIADIRSSFSDRTNTSMVIFRRCHTK